MLLEYSNSCSIECMLWIQGGKPLQAKIMVNIVVHLGFLLFMYSTKQNFRLIL